MKNGGASLRFSFGVRGSLPDADVLFRPCRPSENLLDLVDVELLHVVAAGPRYLGVELAGFGEDLADGAVMARRESESMLILQTALLAALRSSSRECSTAAFSAPPYLLIVSTSSWEPTTIRGARWGSPEAPSRWLPARRMPGGAEPDGPSWDPRCTARG